MRKVNIKNRTHNHTDSFAQGVKQLAREKSVSESAYSDYELNAILRYEQETATQPPVHTPNAGFHVVDLLKELSWMSKGFRF